MNAPSNALWNAYRLTTYFAGEEDKPRRFALRVGHCHPDLDRWLAEHGVNDWAFITAFNPFSTPRSVSENELRQRQLEGRLRELGITFLPGEGVADDGGWPAEPSFLACGIAEETAVALGRDFHQHAILAGRRGEPARLIACEPPVADNSL